MRKQVMIIAHQIRRAHNNTVDFGSCLKAAWVIAKAGDEFTLPAIKFDDMGDVKIAKTATKSLSNYLSGGKATLRDVAVDLLSDMEEPLNQYYIAHAKIVIETEMFTGVCFKYSVY